MREVVGSIPTATTIPDSVKNPPRAAPAADFEGRNGILWLSVISLPRTRTSFITSLRNSFLYPIFVLLSFACISRTYVLINSVGIGRTLLFG